MVCGMVKIPVVSIPIRNRDPNLRDVMIEILLCNVFMVNYLINIIAEEDHHFFFRERCATTGNACKQQNTQKTSLFIKKTVLFAFSYWNFQVSVL